MTPLVSVITPTWRRHDMLLGRCIPSVQAQTYEPVEHIVVSDGPDEVLRAGLCRPLPVQQGLLYSEMNYHEPDEDNNFGHWARLRGVELSAGGYVTYCDDDDSLRPEHCALLAAALDDDPGAGFAVSRMVSHHAHAVVIGWGPLALGNFGTPMLMHRREILDVATWGPPSWIEDWELVERWLDAGIKYVNVDAETSDVYPSVFRL